MPALLQKLTNAPGAIVSIGSAHLRVLARYHQERVIYPMTIVGRTRYGWRCMFGPLVAGYLFFGGAGAGTCCAACVLALLVPRDAVTCVGESSLRGRRIGALRADVRYRRFFGISFACAFGFLAVGALMLLSDAGSASALIMLASNPTWTFLSLGALSLAVALALSLVLAAAWSGLVVLRYRVARFLEWLLLAFGVFVVVYTGLLLASMPAVPIWSTPLLPVLFIVSSLSCGLAVVVASSSLSATADAFGSVIGRLTMFDLAFLAVEAVVATAFIAVAFTSSYEVASQGASMLVSGSLRGLFLVGFAGVGLLVPAIIESLVVLGRAASRNGLLVASIAVLVGGFVLRYCIVAVGAHPEVWTVIS